MIACILLSAGLSQRFGSPKALARINGDTVIEHQQKILLSTQIDEIIIVLGAQADQIKPYLLNHKLIKSVYNKDYKFGQTSSFKTGLQGVSENIQGVLLLPVDYPFIDAKTIDILIGYFLNNHSLIILPSFNGKKGHPPLFSAALKEEFLRLDNEQGLNTVAHHHSTETTILPVEDAGVIRSFNTQQEFSNNKEIFIRR